MKHLSIYLSLIAIIFLLTACPDPTSVPLAKKGTIKVDNFFVGNWSTNDELEEVENFIVTKNDDYSFKIEAKVWDFITDETSVEKFIAWFVRLDRYDFVVAQQLTSNNQLTDDYFLYNYEISSGKLLLRTVKISDEISKEITTSENYKKQILLLMQNKNFLSSPTIYKRK